MAAIADIRQRSSWLLEGSSPPRGGTPDVWPRLAEAGQPRDRRRDGHRAVRAPEPLPPVRRRAGTAAVRPSARADGQPEPGTGCRDHGRGRQDPGHAGGFLRHGRGRSGTVTNPFGYTDPAEAAHPPCPAPVQAPQPVVSPLAGLDQAIPQIMYGNGDTTPPYPHVREDMVT